MSFLTPLFLLGGLAIVGPILFHLVRRTTRERTRFGSLMFLRPTPPRLNRRSRIEHWLLLLLRAVVLAVLAMAFARPFLKSLAAEKALPAATQRVVLLLDTSASMAREDLWSKALSEAESEIEKAGPGADLALATFDRSVVPRLSFEDWQKTPKEQRLSLARERLNSLKVTSAGTFLAPALSTAAEWLADQSAVANSALKREIVVVSDLQEGSHPDAIQGFEWPKGIRVRLVGVAPEAPGNAGLQLMADPPADTAAEAPAVRVRVTNSADSRHESFQIGWAGGTASEFQGKSVDAYVPPGQSRVVGLPWAAGSKAGHIRLRGDAAAFDNDLPVTAPQPIKAVVSHVGRAVTDEPRGPLFFLQRAFGTEGPVSVEIRSHRPDGSAATVSDGPALAVVTDALDPATSNAVSAWMASGGKSLVLLRDPGMAETLGRLIEQPAPPVIEKSGPSYAILGEIAFDHPLFRPFADPRFSDFSKIRFWKHRTLDLSALKKASVLARFDDADPAIVEIPVGQGRAIVLTSGWQPEDSQLALSSKFPALLASLLELTGKVTPPPAQVLAGETPPAGAAIASTDKPGLFPSGDRTIAVVLDPMESLTAPLEPETLEKLGVPLISAAAADEEHRQVPQDSLAGATEAEGRQKLWRWLILTALGLLIVESLLAGRTAAAPAGQTAAPTA